MGILIGKLYVDICNTVTPPSRCGKIDPSLVLFVADNIDYCVSLVSSNIDSNDYMLMDKEHPLDGFKVFKHNQKFEVDIKCAHDSKEPVANLTAEGLEVQSNDSCGEINEAAKMFSTHKYLLSFIFMMIGVILLSVGGYKWDTLIGFIGFIAGFSFMFVIFWGFVQYKDESTSYIIIIAIAAIVGVLCAYLCKTFVILSYILMGFASGLFLSKYILTTFQFSGETVK